MSLISTIETDLSDAGKWLEKEAETIGADVWGIFKGVWTTLEPEAWSALIGLINTVLSKIQSNEIGDILQSVLEEAETQGLSFVQTLAEDFLNAVISALKLKAA